MQLTLSTALLALPLLAAAEGPLDQYQAQFQNFLGNFGSYIPTASRVDQADAHSAKTGDKKMSVLHLDNWKKTLYEPVPPGTTKPVDFWVAVTGGKKTCFDRCARYEAAWNETAIKFAKETSAPNMGYLNCDEQPVLCTAWSASPGTVWMYEMLPPGQNVTIWKKWMNLTTVTSDDFVKLRDVDPSQRAAEESWVLNETIFHPFNSWVGRNGLSHFVGYFFWAFNILPSWAMMLVISFVSRGMMNRRMANANQQGQPGAPAGAAPRGARPGDARG